MTKQKNITVSPAGHEFFELIEPIIRANNNKIKLGNVEFWIDQDGPWQGETSYNLPACKWDHDAIAKDVAELIS